jgi:hypothetical protein
MRRLSASLLTVLLIQVVAVNSAGQQNRDGRDKPNDPADTFKLIAPKFALSKRVKGAPFSASAVTETIQTLGDGNQIVRKSESRMYRDGEGRTRNEGTIDTIGKWAINGDAEQVVFINDPVTGFTYSLIPRTRTAYRYRITPQTLSDIFTAGAPKPNMPGSKPGAVSDKPRPKGSLQPPPPANVAKPEKPTPAETLNEGDGSNRVKNTELLGKQVIEGVEATGTRTTLTIPAGEIGNTLPIRIIDESWYSEELQMTVMTKHSDPRSGDRIYRLTNINRAEPAHALFEVPADYVIQDESASPARRGRPDEDER